LPRMDVFQKTEKQIAFYGGNFTGIDPGEQIELLGTAQEFIEKGLADSIRISTRPDYIDETILNILKRFPVKTVEIGAQSMDDAVLERCGRGHCAADTIKAVELLKAYGFETGVHLMPGLPGDDPQLFEATVARVIAMKPDTVRIHPTLVFADTELAMRHRSGEYVPLTLEGAIDLCACALTRFRAAGIEVIRVGVQTTAAMEAPGAVLAGPFHPAFRALVEGRIFYAMAQDLLKTANLKGNKGALPSFRVCPRDLSDFRGISNRNMEALRDRYGMVFRVVPDCGLKRGEVVLAVGERIFYSNRSTHGLKAATEETIYM
jgi:histone acetyltransferase (RNA polymerase elongator complex component)